MARATKRAPCFPAPAAPQLHGWQSAPVAARQRRPRHIGRVHEYSWNLSGFRVSLYASGGSLGPRTTPRKGKRRPARFVERQTMPVRVPEVASVLGLVLLLLIAKHVPLLSAVPWTSITGFVCFAFAT